MFISFNSSILEQELVADLKLKMAATGQNTCEGADLRMEN
jgi:hypothetical protein